MSPKDIRDSCEEIITSDRQKLIASKLMSIDEEGKTTHILELKWQQ